MKLRTFADGWWHFWSVLSGDASFVSLFGFWAALMVWMSIANMTAAFIRWCVS